MARRWLPAVRLCQSVGEQKCNRKREVDGFVNDGDGLGKRKHFDRRYDGQPGGSSTGTTITRSANPPIPTSGSLQALLRSAVVRDEHRLAQQMILRNGGDHATAGIGGYR